jgi:L-threonylcarbamoyladenylate synthase
MTICQPNQQAITKATTLLKDGGVVSFATETVYGIGCDTFNIDAIKTIYALKNRPNNNPMIAHILDVAWVNQLATDWCEQCDLLAEAFWPGPLTIVLPKKENVPSEACGGFGTIAMRCPSHPVARMLLTSFDSPISAPSANVSGRISPTTAKHVEDEFAGEVLIINGGSCEKGIESTVISMVDTPTVLRLGSVSLEAIESRIGNVWCASSTTQTNSPGTTLRHYAPHAPVKLFTKEQVSELDDTTCVVLALHGTPQKSKQIIQMPTTSDLYARHLYASLREADTANPKVIAIESPPSGAQWNAIHDRLHRCCAEE